MLPFDVPKLVRVDKDLRLPAAIEFNAQHNPDYPCFVFNGSTELKDIQVVNRREFYEAAQRASRLVRPDPETMPTGQVVALLTITDSIVYQTVLSGTMLSGLVPFPIFPKITPEGVLNLLKVSGCHRMLSTTKTLKPMIDAVKALDPSWELTIQETPFFDDLYPGFSNGKSVKASEDPYPPFYTDLPDDAPCVYLHSSGSTGLPKAVPYTYKVLSTWSKESLVTRFEAREPYHCQGSMLLANGHFMSFICGALLSSYANSINALFPPAVSASNSLPIIPTPDNVLQHCILTGSNCLVTVPAFLHAWAGNEKHIEALKTIDWVFYAGGSVSAAIGNKLVSSGVDLRQSFASTETGVLAECADHKEWDYIQLAKTAKFRAVEQGGGAVEFHVLDCDTHLCAIHNLPDVPGYATSDILEKHPTLDLWKIVGRADDVIVHANGERTIPAPIELVIGSCPLIKGVIIFGRNHVRPGALIEPHDADASLDRDAFIEKIWPFVEEANSTHPSYSRIDKDLILLAGKGRELPRAGKGTVMRKAALKEFHEDIEALYASVKENVVMYRS